MVADESHDDKTQSFIALTSGTEVLHYKVLEKIGSGGMGEVYLALDTKLNRKVALKFMPAHLAGNAEMRARFVREAQAAAKLDHPNIVPVHEVGEYSGRPFFAMAHVEGKSLRQVIKEGKLKVEQSISLAMQICEGLHKAHEAGVVHRDIKPGNILIDNENRARIVDFGLATVSGEEKLTKTGSTLGTVGYMSPEQIEGKQVDLRSDIFSVGVILYEMLTGRRPFEGDNDAAISHSITTSTPEPIARYKSGTTGELQQIVDKALTKDPSLRYQHADGMLTDLKRLQLEQTPIEKRKIGFWVVAAAFAIVVGFLGYELFFQSDRSDHETKRIMLAVLPFENLGDSEDDGFADGITDAITSRIAKISGLGVIARTSVLQYKGTTKRIKEIGSELGVDYVLEGSILWDKSGDTIRFRIIPQLIQVSDESHIWTNTYQRALDQIFSVQAEIATTIAENLDVTLLQSEQKALADRPTENMEAYQAYLAGRRGVGITAHTISMYERAIQLDSNFALAHAELSIAHSAMYHFGQDHSEGRLQKAKAAVDRALILQPYLPEAHLAMGFYFYWGHREYENALREFEIAEENLPNDPRILAARAYILRRQGRFGEAVNRLERAFELNPNDAGVLNAIIETYQYLRDYRKVLRLCDKGLSNFPDNYECYRQKFWAHILQEGDLDQAHTILLEVPHSDRTKLFFWRAWFYLNIYERDYTGAFGCIDSSQAEYWPDHDRFWVIASRRGLVYRYMGDSSRALTLFDSARTFLESHSKEFDSYIGFHSELGLVYAGLGRKEEAIREGSFALELMPISKDAFLGARRIYDLAQIYVMVGEYEKAVELLDTLMIIPFNELSIHILKLDPIYDPLRDHPRFQALIEKYEKEHGI